MPADDGALVLRVPRRTPVPAIALLVALTALLALYTFTGPWGPRDNPPLQWILVAVYGAVAIAMLRSIFMPSVMETVIDADGIREGGGGRALRWPEIWKLGWDRDGRELWIAPYPDMPGDGLGLYIPVADVGADDAEVLAAIERFARAAGRELELPAPRPR